MQRRSQRVGNVSFMNMLPTSQGGFRRVEGERVFVLSRHAPNLDSSAMAIGAFGESSAESKVTIPGVTLTERPMDLSFST